MKIKAFFKRFFASIAIGIGAAIPGISASAIAIIFKIYDSIIWAFSNFTKHFLKALIILLPVALGIFISLIPCIVIFKNALECYTFGLISIFAGFMIGSLPGIMHEVKDVKPTTKHILIAVLAGSFVIGFGFLSVFVQPKIDLNNLFIEFPFWLYFILIGLGLLASTALMIPGLSGSFILLVIGFYKPLLNTTVNWGKAIIFDGDASRILPLILLILAFGAGCVCGTILCSRFMSKMMAKHRDMTYFAIIGFVTASIPVLFFNYNIFIYYLDWAGINSWLGHVFKDLSVEPQIKEVSHQLPMWLEMLIGFASMILSAIGGYFLSRKAMKA